jgi:hypothetical protein
MDIGLTQLNVANARSCLNAGTYGTTGVGLGQAIAACVVHPEKRGHPRLRRADGVKEYVTTPMVPSLHIRGFCNLRAYGNGRPDSNASKFDHREAFNEPAGDQRSH